ACSLLRYDLHSFPTRRSSDLEKHCFSLFFTLIQNSILHTSFDRLQKSIQIHPFSMILNSFSDSFITFDHTHSMNSNSFNLIHIRSEEHTSELQSRSDLVCRLL